ncbi:outer membrane protein assembly factor BamB family protein [Lysobacter tyrosinilyticus]
MKAIGWRALACASVVLAGCPQNKDAEEREVVAPKVSAVQIATSTSPSSVATGVTLTLATRPMSVEITKGDRYAITLVGTWQNTGSGAVYLQVSDNAGKFVTPAPVLASTVSTYRNRPSSNSAATYRIEASLPTTTAAGTHTGLLTARACADSLCVQPYVDTTHSIGYTLKVNAFGEWETLQRTSRHDGYVPVELKPRSYVRAWTYQPTSNDETLSDVVTGNGNVYFSERESHTVYAKRATDGVTQWRRVFTQNQNPRLSPPTVSNGVVYVSTTGSYDTWLYALRASDGTQSYLSQFQTQWAEILNPTVCNGRVYVNAGAYSGEVYAYNLADGAPLWQASGGSYGRNTPAADDNFVYAYSGSTLSVFNATTGLPLARIGPTPYATTHNYYATPMLGSADHVLTYGGTTYGPMEPRQLLDYSVANKTVRWMSISLYNNYPAVAKGVVYATSNEWHTLDALDEATGRLLWSWKPQEQGFNFIGNVVVTDNIVLVSTNTRIYAIDLMTHRDIWSAPTPGTMSISADRMLFVSMPRDAFPYPAPPARITAYRPN